MQIKKNKPLQVTEDQQKAWDLITVHWGKITSFLGSLIVVIFWLGWYAKTISENGERNDITLMHAKEIEEVRETETANCNEIMKNYKALIDRIIPINENKNEK